MSRARKCNYALSIYLTEELANALAMIADAHGCGESTVVRNILTAWLQQQMGHRAARPAQQLNGNGNAVHR